MALHLVPVGFRHACQFVAEHHRHHRPPQGMRFCVGVADEHGVLRGVAIVGRPVAMTWRARTLNTARRDQLALFEEVPA